MTTAQPTPQTAPQTALKQPIENGPHATLARPIENGPQTAIPQTDIPHMGTSQASVPHPHIGSPTPSPAQAAPPAAPQAAPAAAGTHAISQDAIDAAIAHVQKTGNTEGIAPEVLGAACAQIEAQAAAQGVDLGQQADAAPQGPAHHVEAAVMDKQGTLDAFEAQRQSLTNAVADQREAMQQPYKDAMAKAGSGGDGGDGVAEANAQSMAGLAAAIKDLDPSTVALISAMGALNANPKILNSVIWIEVIRTVRGWIAAEAKKQIQDALHYPQHTPPA